VLELVEDEADCTNLVFDLGVILARRFCKQIFLSVDVPPLFVSMGQGSTLLMEIEKGIIDSLKRLEEVE
jgi:hypothetical protein